MREAADRDADNRFLLPPTLESIEKLNICAKFTNVSLT